MLKKVFLLIGPIVEFRVSSIGLASKSGGAEKWRGYARSAPRLSFRRDARRAFAIGAMVFAGIIGGYTAKGSDSNAISKRSDGKLVVAHYMPSFANMSGWDAACNPYHPHAGNLASGGNYREAPLLANCWFKQTPIWGVDLHAIARREMRLAREAGIDGFVFDYGAGSPKKADDLHIFLKRGIIGAFFEAAEKDFPDFKLTLCLDQATIKDRERRLLTIKQFLERHGDSPNMLRINGKIAFLSYRAVSLPPYDFQAYSKRRLTDEQIIENQRQVIENWKWIWSQIDRPVAFIADMAPAWLYEKGWHGADSTVAKEFDIWAEAFDGLSVFGPLDTPEQAEKYYTMMNEACRRRGKLFFPCVGSIGWRRENPKARVFMHGSDFFRKSWDLAINLGAQGVQVVTWNDYSEETNIAPSINHGYALLELTKFYSRWFKDGRMPEIVSDQIFLFYRRYVGRPKPSEFPDTATPWWPLDDEIEVMTLCKAPAELKLVIGDEDDGKTISIPAGLNTRRFPLKPGFPAAVLFRDGEEIVKVKGLAPVTDQPYRCHLGTYCASSGFEREFRQDAGFSFDPSDPRWVDIDKNGVADWLQLIDASPAGKVMPAE